MRTLTGEFGAGPMMGSAAPALKVPLCYPAESVPKVKRLLLSLQQKRNMRSPSPLKSPWCSSRRERSTAHWALECASPFPRDGKPVRRRQRNARTRVGIISPVCRPRKIAAVRSQSSYHSGAYSLGDANTPGAVAPWFKKIAT